MVFHQPICKSQRGSFPPVFGVNVKKHLSCHHFRKGTWPGEWWTSPNFATKLSENRCRRVAEATPVPCASGWTDNNPQCPQFLEHAGTKAGLRNPGLWKLIGFPKKKGTAFWNPYFREGGGYGMLRGGYSRFAAWVQAVKKELILYTILKRNGEKNLKIIQWKKTIIWTKSPWFWVPAVNFPECTHLVFRVFGNPQTIAVCIVSLFPFFHHEP